MDLLVAMAVLGASLLHASWHALVKSTGDRVIALAGMNVVSAAAAIAGVLLICAGLMLLAVEAGGRGTPASVLGIAGCAGLAVAVYSVLDAYGIRLAGDWFSFTVWLIAIDGIAFVGYALVGAVTALRETGVLFAALIGAVALGERATWKRYAAAVLVIAGVGVIALGRDY